MNVHQACLAMMSWLDDIQKFDKSFELYGPVHADFISKWDDQLYSLLFTGFGRIPNPAWLQSKWEGPALASKFTDILEVRACRRNYQEPLARLERALKAAVEKYGEDTVTSLTDRPDIRVYGEVFVKGLQRAGFVFEDAEFLDKMFQKAKQSSIQRYDDFLESIGQPRIAARTSGVANPPTPTL